jgi:cell wall assembly regulator SMI1
VDRLWSRIERWLAANAPTLAAGFNPPATARELAATERLLGVQLPEDVRQSYHRHNGHWSLFGGWEWYSLEGLRRSWTLWNDLLSKGCFAGKRTDANGSKVRQDWWNPRWIPIAHLESDEVCLDFAPGPRGKVGQIIVMWNDGGQRRFAGASFREWLTDFANDLERWDYVVCRETGELDHWDTLWATLERPRDKRKQECWHLALELARQFGWEPAGTELSYGGRVDKWDATDYTLHEGQEVTAADACALAVALSRALKAIPKGKVVRPPENASPEVAFFTGRFRGKLTGLVQYCKRGAFRITD